MVKGATCGFHLDILRGVDQLCVSAFDLDHIARATASAGSPRCVSPDLRLSGAIRPLSSHESHELHESLGKAPSALDDGPTKCVTQPISGPVQTHRREHTARHESQCAENKAGQSCRQNT